MTKDLNLEAVNSALSREVQKLQEELKAADKEMLRLRAGGCARDQGLTQYCAEAEALTARVAELEGENKNLKLMVDVLRKELAESPND